MQPQRAQVGLDSVADCNAVLVREMLVHHDFRFVARAEPAAGRQRRNIERAVLRHAFEQHADARAVRIVALPKERADAKQPQFVRRHAAHRIQCALERAFVRQFANLDDEIVFAQRVLLIQRGVDRCRQRDAGDEHRAGDDEHALREQQAAQPAEGTADRQRQHGRQRAGDARGEL